MSRRPRRAPHQHVKLQGSPENIQVVVRIRPLSDAECPGSTTHPLVGPSLIVNAAENTVNGMMFDRVLTPQDGQQAAFHAVRPAVESWLEGYNGCVLAYGHTGSGKTHTMLGPEGGKKNLDGVIPQIATYALERIANEERDFRELHGQLNAAAVDGHAAATTERRNGGRQAAAGCTSQMRLVATYVELYNDELRDLLTDAKSQGVSIVGAAAETLAIRERSPNDVFVEGATECVIRSVDDLMCVVAVAAQRRATGRTNMNAHSSRSHAILGLHMQHRWRDQDCVLRGPRVFRSRTSSLQLVDLAGSEYAKRTGNVGQQLRESIAINTGLFVLGNVIAALSGDPTRAAGGHIPYRDSLLTRLLQPCLGGDARTTLIVCCSPAPSQYEDSLSAVRYAFSARRIQTVACRHDEQVELPSTNPMDGDIVDMDECLNRRCYWVETAFGDIYCRCVGDPLDDLILFVHGSGPTNSTWWNHLAVRAWRWTAPATAAPAATDRTSAHTRPPSSAPCSAPSGRKRRPRPLCVSSARVKAPARSSTRCSNDHRSASTLP